MSETVGRTLESLPIGSPERILVVDDDRMTRELVRTALEAGGFQVRTVEQGVAALTLFPAFQPDLVILDILMPGMDGPEVCRRLRALEGGRDVPVLFLTSDTRKETQRLAIEAGGDDLIHKPSFHAELLIRVRSLLRMRRLQQDLVRERDHLRETQRQREMLQNFLVHDLKSMLQTIQCNAELLGEDTAGGGRSGLLLPRILESIQAMDRMTQDLLDIAKSEAGALRLEVSRFLLEPMVQQWGEEVRSLFERKAQELRVEISGNLVVEGDPELLRRCVLNLLGNSAKYGPKGGETRVEGEFQGRVVQLRVRDQGPGIPEGLRERIFDPFVRLSRDSGTARASSGLGLAFCRAVARAHGGRIWAEPNEPVGTLFCLEWPR